MAVGIDIPPPLADSLGRFIRLMAKWNATINLTALQVDPPSDEAIDRLVLEPLAASTHFPDEPVDWLDLGSGGGSPAIPLKLVRQRARLTMVESKSRKAAFLRDAIRQLGIEEARVEEARFQDLDSRFEHNMHVVTARAVRMDHQLAGAAGRVLRPAGRLLFFARVGSILGNVGGFKLIEAVPLVGTTILAIYESVPRGT
jgi:16S rRNA (guanine527-N7)-methyltransferase